MRFKAALVSKAGGRKANEDFASFSEKKGYGCYLVADGLGGHRGGALASKRACESIIEAFHNSPGASVNHLVRYLEYAGKAMDDLQKELGLPDAAKTTLVVLLASRSGKVTWAHIGDSRLYYFRKNSLAFQTKDHSLPQRLVDVGEITPDQVRFHEDRNRLLSVFTDHDISRFTYLNKIISIKRGDAFLLCSDGFWDYINEDEMVNALKTTKKPELWLSRMEVKLLLRATGKYDNYTALAVLVR